MRRSKTAHSLVIADAFCGAGGSSEGMRRAFDARNVPCQLVAINHWPIAITAHSANHPDALHHCVDLTKARLGELVPGGRVDAVWLSPSCTTFSYAQGGKSIDDQMRAGAWVTAACAEIYQPRLIIVENVPPFIAWGPLDGRGRPMKSRRGDTFRAWLASIESLGFHCSYKFLNAADFGEAQTRTRFFLVAVRESVRRTFAWPAPTHSRTGEATLFGGRQKWRGAREILDPTMAGKSILDRKKPLSAMTLRRIAHGSRTYWGTLSNAALATIDEAARIGLAFERARTSQLRKKLGQARKAQAAANRLAALRQSVARSEKSVARFEALITDLASWGVSDAASGTPLSSLVGANRTHNAPRPSDEPLPPATTSTGGGLYTIEPAVEPLVLGQHGGGNARDASQPISTIASAGAVSLVEAAIIVPLRSNGMARSVDQPIPTVAAGGTHHGVAEPVAHLGERLGRRDAADIVEPAVLAQLGNVRIDRLVIVDGAIRVFDVRFRMIQPHELQLAQGFPATYAFPGTKEQQTKMIGNAVSVRVAAALWDSALDVLVPQSARSTEGAVA